MKDYCHINFNKTGLTTMLLPLFNIVCNIHKQEVIKYYSTLFYFHFLYVDPKRGNSIEYATNLGPCYHLLTCTCIITSRFLKAFHGRWDCHIQEWITIKWKPSLGKHKQNTTSVTIPKQHHWAVAHAPLLLGQVQTLVLVPNQTGQQKECTA